MVLTKLYFKNKGIVFSAVATFVLAVATLGENNMIQYYCSPTSLFLGINFSQTRFSAYCSISVIISHIIGVLLLFLFLALLLDGIRLGTINLYKRIIYIFRNRNAKITVVAVTVGNEHFVAIKNGEFFLRADNVVVNSRFIFYDNKFDGNIKWSENNSKDGETSICSRKYKLLHAVTFANDKFIIHMTRGDEAFPFPGQDDPYYVFPLRVTGTMSFLGYTVKKVKFETYEEVMITRDRKVEIRRRR